MTDKSKTLLEIDFYEIKKHLDDVSRYFSITKNFSLKTNGHLKMLAHLINNLIQSEDYLELTEEILHVPVKSSKNNENRVLTKSPNSLIEKTAQREDEKLVEKIMGRFQSENDKMWQILQDGENKSNYLKDYFERVLTSIKKEQNDSNQNGPNQNNFNKENSDQTKNQNYRIDINLQNPYRDTDSTFIEPFNNKNNKFRSTYGGNGRNYEDYAMSQSVREKMGETTESLKYEIGKMSKEIQELRLVKENEESGLKEIVKKMIEVKMENEMNLKEKENEIQFLRNKLEEIKDKLADLEDEIEDLKNENKELEAERKKLLKNQNGILNDEKKNKEIQDLKKFKKENIDLKKQIKLLESKASKKNNKNTENFYQIKYNGLQEQFFELQKMKDELEEKNERLCVIFEKNMENINVNLIGNNKTENKREIDILKCLYVQSKYLENIEYNSVNENSEENEEVNESVVIDL
jgi:hypothetical protein